MADPVLIEVWRLSVDYIYYALRFYGYTVDYEKLQDALRDMLNSVVEKGKLNERDGSP